MYMCSVSFCFKTKNSGSSEGILLMAHDMFQSSEAQKKPPVTAAFTPLEWRRRLRPSHSEVHQDLSAAASFCDLLLKHAALHSQLLPLYYSSAVICTSASVGFFFSNMWWQLQHRFSGRMTLTDCIFYMSWTLFFFTCEEEHPLSWIMSLIQLDYDLHTSAAFIGAWLTSDKHCDYLTFTGDLLACVDMHEMCKRGGLCLFLCGR